MLSSARSRRALDSSDKGVSPDSDLEQQFDYMSEGGLRERITGYEDMRFGDGNRPLLGGRPH